MFSITFRTFMFLLEQLYCELHVMIFSLCDMHVSFVLQKFSINIE